ncbi:MAG: EAL domain-containing protein [Pirellulaceae bacterium]|nr:EAL domain-containing protein [Pirellulaceae bacterium]
MQATTPQSADSFQWFLVHHNDGDHELSTIPIHGKTQLGRNSDCDVVITSTSVSAYHANIVEEGGVLWLHDLDSTNGTFVNGQPVRNRIRLSGGDTIRCANAIFNVSQKKQDGSETVAKTLRSIQFERLFNGGLLPYFQPIFHIGEKHLRVAGLEMLGRSRVLGLRTPEQMFATATQLNMEIELSGALMRQGFEASHAHLPGDLELFLNTHLMELRDSRLLTSLRNIRESFESRPLTLEVSAAALDEPKDLVNLSKALDQLDIKLAIHNFGAAEPRLFALQDVSPDYIKFDARLIRQIDQAPERHQKFLVGLLRFMDSLGVISVAERVETIGEHETLLEMGFTIGQGIHYSEPSSLPDCIEWLSDNALTESSGEPNTEAGPLIRSFLGPRESETENQTSYHDAEWLLAQPADHYTVQVLSAISLQRAENYVASQPDPQAFAIFCKPGKTRMLYIVVYGMFADREAARKAAGELPALAVSPWIRMLSGVQSEIRGKS